MKRSAWFGRADIPVPRIGTEAVGAGRAILGEPNNQEHKAGKRDHQGEEPPAAHVAIVQPAHRDRETGEQDRERPQIRDDIEFRLKAPSTTPPANATRRVNKCHHQNSDGKARPLKLT
jgi:hypothetical protein